MLCYIDGCVLYGSESKRGSDDEISTRSTGVNRTESRRNQTEL